MIPSSRPQIGHITLHSGVSIDVNRLIAQDYYLNDVAHSLSRINRFGGHTPIAYSVADHAVRVALWVRDNDGSIVEQLCALHHDDTEAFGLGDVCKPVKMLYPQLEELEAQIWATCIAPALSLPVVMPEIVHAGDKALLDFELGWRTGQNDLCVVDEKKARDHYLSLHYALVASRREQYPDNEVIWRENFDLARIALNYTLTTAY